MLTASKTARATGVDALTPGLFRWRWIVVGVFVLSNVLNFVDRLLLASSAPAIRGELHLSNFDYGRVVSVFSIAYAFMAPIAGLVVDRLGLTLGAVLAVGLWSIAGIGTGFVSNVGELMLCRAILGMAEAASLPFLSKANATFLPTSEWGLAGAAGAVALTVGSVSAPLMTASFSPSWRSPFVLTGALGFVWILVWTLTARSLKRLPAYSARRLETPGKSVRELLKDARIWRVIVAYPLVSIVLIVWQNWTTLFLVQQFHLSPQLANQEFAWIPPIFATAGGFFNGWLVYRWIRSGMIPISARALVCKWAAPLFAVSLAIPYLETATMAIAGVAAALFACQIVISSLVILPIDLWGPSRAAFGISLLACSFSLLQTFVSPLIGISFDRFGIGTVCVVCTLLPLVGVIVVSGIKADTVPDAR
jgi:ACS family hexuronate transporter-like MFS transporter